MQFVLTLHGVARWAILIFGLWTVINAITGITGKRTFTAADNRSNLLFMIFCDVQLLLGLILYFSNGWFDRLKNFSQYKTDAAIRFFSMEHLTMMLLAWVLVHIGRASVKKAATDAAKHKKMLIFFGIALLLILAAIPWPFRSAIARPWL